MGIFSEYLRMRDREGRADREATGFEPILFEQRLSPEVCDSIAERAASGEVKRRRRGLSYGYQTLSILAAVWGAAGCP
jgi:hypothetical protein